MTTTHNTPQTKWNAALPEFLQAPIEKEQVVYKEQIFTQLTRIQQESTKSNALTTLLLNTLRLLYRYTFICHFHLSLQEKQQLVLILYDILVDDNTEPALQTKVAQHMVHLLKTKDPLEDSFQVPWRPLWDLIHRYYFKSNDLLRYVPSHSHAMNMRALIGTIKKYFPAESVGEILAEARPFICVFDHMYHVGLGLLTLFLPASRKHEHEEPLRILMTHWEWNDANPAVDYYILTYLARLAAEKCGEVDFDPYLDLIFTNTLRMFDLPIGSNSESNYNKYPSPMCQFFGAFQQIKDLNVVEIGKLLAWILKDEGDYDGDLGADQMSDDSKTTPHTAFDFLKQMLRSMGHFYHPSNAGRYSHTIYSFLFNLTHRFARRMLWEKDERNSQPAQSKLSQRFIDAFVRTTLPIARQSIFAKNPQNSSSAVHAMKHLCFAAPQICFPSLIELITNALTTLVHSHQTPAILRLLTACVNPVFTQLDKYPEALDYLPELLNMCLNGLDTNDMIKTNATCGFLGSVFAFVPFVRPTGPPDQASIPAPQIVHYYEEFCIQLLDRFFHLYRNSSDKSAEDAQRFPYEVMRSLLYTMFTQMDDELFDLCAKRVLTFVEGHFLPNAANIVGVTIHAASKRPGRAVETLRPFMEFFHRRLVNPGTGELNSLTESEITYYCTLLSSCLKMHPGIVGHQKELHAIMKALFFHCTQIEVKSEEVVLSSLVFHVSLQSLAMVYLLDGQSVPPSVWNSDEFKRAPHKYIGEMYTLEEAAPQWHYPSQEELSFAVEIWNEFSGYCVETFQQYIANPQSISAHKLRNTLQVFKYIFQGAAVFMPEASTDTRKEYRKRMYRKNEQPITGDIRVDESTLKFTREDIGKILRDIYRVATRNAEKINVKAVLLIGESLHTVMTRRYITMKDVGDKKKSVESFKDSYFKSSNPKGRNRYFRTLQLSRLKFHFLSRLCLRDVKYPRLFDDLLDILQDMALSSFSKVRKTGQVLFSVTLQAYNRKLFADRMIPLLRMLSEHGSVPEEKIKGICYLLKHNSVLKRIFVGWDTLSELAKNIVRVRVEKPSNQDLVAGLFPRFAQHYVELKIHTDNDEQLYNETVESLLAALDEVEHWRAQSVTIGALNLFVRSDMKIMFPVHGALRIFDMLDSEMLTVRTAAANACSLLFAQYRPHQLRKVIETHGERLSIEDRSAMEGTRVVDSADDMTDANTVQWSEVTYLDKNYLGWESLPLRLETYDYSRGTFDISDEHVQQKRREFAQGLLQKRGVIQRFGERLCLMPGLRFNATIARIFKMYFQILGHEDSLDVAREFLQGLRSSDMMGTGKPEELSTCSHIAHILSGLMRASKHWSPSQITACTQLTKDTLSYVLLRMTPQCIPEINHLFNFIVYDLDVRRTTWATEWLSTNVDNIPAGASAVQESMWYRFICTILGEVSWRSPQMIRRFFDIAVDRMLAHPYDKIRDVCSYLLQLSYRHSWQPKREDVVNSVGATEQAAVTARNLSIPRTTPHTNVEYVEPLTSEPAVRTCSPESYARLDYQVSRILESFYNAYTDHLKAKSISPTDESSKKLLQTSRTIVVFVHIVLRVGFPTMIAPFLDRLIDVLVQISFMADLDLQQHAYQIFTLLSSAIFPKSTTRHIIRDIQKQLSYTHPEESATVLIQHTSWRLKTATLAVLQSFVFRHQFFLLDFSETLPDVLLQLMRDPSAEVKHLSMETLSGFMLISPEEKREQLAKRFMDLHSKMRTSLRLKKAIPKEELHFLILGLSAVILSHPYSLPEYLKPVLLLLSEYQNVDVFADKEIRGTFSQFWKTHQDEWETKYADMFTSDEKYQIKLSLSGSYFA